MGTSFLLNDFRQDISQSKISNVIFYVAFINNHSEKSEQELKHAHFFSIFSSGLAFSLAR